MNIVLAGSMSAYQRILEVQNRLQNANHVVTIPSDGGSTDPADLRQYNVEARERIIAADLLLVVNETKHDIEGYVGANTLVEIGMAFAFEKPIFLLNVPSQDQSSWSELMSLTDGVVEDLDTWINHMEVVR